MDVDSISNHIEKKQSSMIEISNNAYDGVIVNNATLPPNKDEFKKEIVRLI